MELPRYRALHLGIAPLRLRFAIPLAVLLSIAGVAAIPASRHFVLRNAGHALVAEDPAAHADVVIVSTDSMSAGILEAGDLVHAGLAPRVAVFTREVSPLQTELRRRGLPYVDLQEHELSLLRALGVTSIDMIPPVVGTNDEGDVLRTWCKAHSIHSVLFISVVDHSRRTRRVLGRALGSEGIEVRVRLARFSAFDPDTWWQTRNGQRVEAVEMQKLLLDFARHPF